MAIETGLEGKPWYVSAAVGAGLAGVLIFGVNYVKFSDMKLQVERQEQKAVELDRTITEGRSAQRSLPQFREEVRLLELQLDQLLRILPSRRDTEGLLRRMRTLTEQGDFDLLSFTPRGKSPRDFYYEWPIQIRLNGSYHELAIFFDRISRFSRIINIEDLRIGSVRRGGDAAHTISAQFIMKTFLYNDPEDEEENA